MSIISDAGDRARFEAIALAGFPLIRHGDDISALILEALERNGLRLEDSDIVVIAHKVVSKAEGRVLDISRLTPSPRALHLAGVTGKPPALIEAILGETKDVLRAKRGVIVVEHLSGHVAANAGIDQSNADASGRDRVVQLPEDADASAEAVRKRIADAFDAKVGVVISDSLGRAWRLGTIGQAIGAAGLPALIDRRGAVDLNGRPLEVTMSGFADAVAAAAVLLMGEGDEGRPVVVIRGLKWAAPDRPAQALVRPLAEDMFR